jgi:hypothetical protein
MSPTVCIGADGTRIRRELVRRLCFRITSYMGGELFSLQLRFLPSQAATISAFRCLTASVRTP